MFRIYPVGIIHRNKETIIEIYPEFHDCLIGLEQFDRIVVLWWFSENDKPTLRAIRQVYPQGNVYNKMRGIFSTRSPFRPNPIAISIVKILKIDIEHNIIKIDEIEAYDNTPVLDIKPFIKSLDCPE